MTNNHLENDYSELNEEFDDAVGYYKHVLTGMDSIPLDLVKAANPLARLIIAKDYWCECEPLAKKELLDDVDDGVSHAAHNSAKKLINQIVNVDLMSEDEKSNRFTKFAYDKDLVRTHALVYYSPSLGQVDLVMRSHGWFNAIRLPIELEKHNMTVDHILNQLSHGNKNNFIVDGFSTELAYVLAGAEQLNQIGNKFNTDQSELPLPVLFFNENTEGHSAIYVYDASIVELTDAVACDYPSKIDSAKNRLADYLFSIAENNSFKQFAIYDIESQKFEVFVQDELYNYKLMEENDLTPKAFEMLHAHLLNKGEHGDGARIILEQKSKEYIDKCLAIGERGEFFADDIDALDTRGKQEVVTHYWSSCTDDAKNKLLNDQNLHIRDRAEFESMSESITHRMF